VCDELFSINSDVVTSTIQVFFFLTELAEFSALFVHLVIGVIDVISTKIKIKLSCLNIINNIV
jgi:hypothetical protein